MTSDGWMTIQSTTFIYFDKSLNSVMMARKSRIFEKRRHPFKRTKKEVNLKFFLSSAKGSEYFSQFT